MPSPRSWPDRIFNALGRVTSSGKGFIPEIDGLRFLAILPVILLHTNTNFQRATSVVFARPPARYLLDTLLGRGDFGVRLFFVISGFILAIPFARAHFGEGKPVKLDRYFLRRLTRLEPPYIITLTAFLLVRLFVNGYSWSQAAPHYFWSLIYQHNIVYGHWSTINPVAWSLEIEVQFYVLVPLLTYVFAIRSPTLRRTVILAAAAGLCLLRYGVDLWRYNLQFSLLEEGHFFLIGFFMCDLYLTHWSRAELHRYRYDVLGVLALAGIYGFHVPHPAPIDRFLFAASIALVFVAGFRSRLFNRFFRNRSITVIGGMCYITYLIHYPLIAFLMLATAKITAGTGYVANLLIQDVIVVPIVIVASAIAFVLIEKPFMYPDWPARVAGRLRRLVGAAGVEPTDGDRS